MGAQVALQIIAAIEALLTVAQNVAATDPVLQTAQASGQPIPDAVHQANFDAIRASVAATRAAIQARVGA